MSDLVATMVVLMLLIAMAPMGAAGQTVYDDEPQHALAQAANRMNKSLPMQIDRST